MPQAAHKTKKHGTNASKPQSNETVEMFFPLILFLIKSGFSQTTILRQCQTAIRSAARYKAKLDVIHIPYRLADSALVNRWLRDPKYLNSAGRPLELPMRGEKSITSLVKECNLNLTSDRLAEHLLNFGVIRRVADKQYRLILRMVDFTRRKYLPFEPNFHFLVDSINAATERLTQSTRAPRLFWRIADNPRIDARDYKAFLSFIDRRSLSFMYEINDWLDEHEIDFSKTRGKKIKLKRLGVGLFGICSDSQ